MLSNNKYSPILESMEDELAKLSMEEEEIIGQMQTILAQKTHLDAKIKTLSKIVPTLNNIKDEAQDLVSTIDGIAKCSDGISDKVKTLDRARSRIHDCQQRVSDLIDLELSSQGVQTAIVNEDYEKGAAHVHRFLSMDQSMLERTATDVENVSSVLKAVRTLQEAASQLRMIVQYKFDEAVKMEDLGSVERFFKVFPLLGLKEEGIRRFCNYLCKKLQETAQKNLQTAFNTPITDKRHNVIYADTLTLLFEGIARIIDIHQPLVETYYGPGHLLSVMAHLQKECDVQVKRILVEFNKHREIKKKIGVIGLGGGASSKAEKLDPKDLDLLIQEITIVHVRFEMYLKFVRRKVLADIEVQTSDQDQQSKDVNTLEQLIKCSELSQSKHELLSNYLQLEQYYMVESISKAVSMDVPDLAQHTSSMVDDSFFIIKKSIRRSILTGSLDGICAVINNACAILENDFCAVLKTRLKQGYPSGYLDLSQAYSVLQTSLQQGRLQPSDIEQTRITFIVALNNANASIEYTQTLCESVLADVEQAIANFDSNKREKLESCLSGLQLIVTILQGIIDYGVKVIRDSVVKPRINPWVDSFLNVNHQMSEDELSEYEAGESFVQSLIFNLDALLAPFKENLLPSNYESLVKALTDEVTSRLEKVVLKTSYNRLGGLVLDKEVRSLAGYLTATTSWSVRDKFARLTQIATVLNLDKVCEITDYFGSNEGLFTWRLTPTEIRAIMHLRNDFKSDEIRRLKL